ncbi:antitoxin [Leclercia tamurae]|uniref:antitoxin n=1 Tax=Leclercia tamurae TaxID=2926467 RepID=UPI0036F48AC2
MERKAKLFKKGRNQAVILPEEFAFDTESVWIRRDEEGNVVLTAKPAQKKTWDEFFRMLENTTVPDSFLSPEERNQSMSKRDPLDGVQA